MCVCVFSANTGSDEVGQLNSEREKKKINQDLHYCHVGLTNFSFLPSQILSISRRGKNTSFINGSKNPKESCEAQNK